MRILKNLDLENVLFLDIETVRVADKLEKGTDLYDSWEYKMRYSREASEKFEDKSLEELFKDKAALYAEFGKIVCITIGKVVNNDLLLKSYSGADEKELLIDFTTALEKLKGKNKYLCLAGHAIKGFDIPYIMRRCIVNQVELPDLIDVAHLKPWELTAIDTLDLWKGTGFYSASLVNISTAMGLPSPKMDIKGFETSDVYYKDNDVDRIRKYCERDVFTVANIIRVCRFEKPFERKEVEEKVEDIKIEDVPIISSIMNGAKLTAKTAKDLLAVYRKLKPAEQEKAATILKSLITKDGNFQQKHFDALAL